MANTTREDIDIFNDADLIEYEFTTGDDPNSYVTSKDAIRKRWKKLIYEKDKFYEEYLSDVDKFERLIAEHLNGTRGLEDKDLYWRLCRAMGISNNSSNYLTREDILERINFKSLFENGEDEKTIIEEMKYRYLMGCGENMTGRMKNVSGRMGEQKFLDCFLSCLSDHVDEIYININGDWMRYSDQDELKIKNVKGISWVLDDKERVLLLDFVVPWASVRVDVVLLDASYINIDLKHPNIRNREDTDIYGENTLIDTQKHNNIENYLASGELKSGVAPSGAIQLWKSAIAAARKVRRKSTVDVKTFVILATIYESIAKDIEHHLEKGDIDKAANLTKKNQLEDICNWLIDL